MRYFPKDFEEALHRPSDVPVSVLRLDMDSFKKINDDFGHPAGDVVMKSYLEAVRDCLGSVGTGYRGRGDEVVALIVGQDHKRATEIAEKIRVTVENLRCKFNDTILPTVTASIGVATTPPESRGKDMETIADDRQNRAKREGKNRVVAN
jgi:diguanylate cyclase (GGDEF)-like protein